MDSEQWPREIVLKESGWKYKKRSDRSALEEGHGWLRTVFSEAHLFKVAFKMSNTAFFGHIDGKSEIKPIFFNGRANLRAAESCQMVIWTVNNKHYRGNA